MKLLAWILLILGASPAFATTWYVRPDGGTRYSTYFPTGQCNGTADASYASTGGTGVNQNCAYNDARFLWTDGEYTTNPAAGYPAWGWVGAGGDTYLLRGSIGTGVSYRVGWSNNSSAYDSTLGLRTGIQGDPFSSGAPVPYSGTAGQHTRILGENYANCHSASAKTQLHGGYGVNTVLPLTGTAYVDVACLDITDFSACGLGGQNYTCNKNIGSLDDYAQDGVAWDQFTTNHTMTDVYIHGLAHNGAHGPLGGGSVLSYFEVWGAAETGVDMDNGSQGTGSLLVQHYKIMWTGCAEEYPIVDAVPYQDCTDDNSGGQGDAFGTATTAPSGAWHVTFDQGEVGYNTQDGIDSLHLTGASSSMTVTRTLAYGNMGNQVKVGGANGTLQNSLIVSNCNAMRQAIPGTPSGYNSRLSDFCRAGDEGNLFTIGPNSILTIDDNTFYGANNVLLELKCDSTNGPCDSTSLIDFRNNVTVGFAATAANGYAGTQITNTLTAPINNDTGSSGTGVYVNPFTNTGSFYSNNVTFNGKSSFVVPQPGETNALSTDPQLTDETYHLYGYGNMTPASGSSPVVGSGVAISGITVDYSGLTRPNPPSRGAYDNPFGTGFTYVNGLSNQNFAATMMQSIMNQTVGANTLNGISNQGVH